MKQIELLIDTLVFNRKRTLKFFDSIKQEPFSEKILGYRPGPGRAHIAWQLMHIAVTEEIFATEKFKQKSNRLFEDQWKRFRGGSVVDDDIPTIETIEETLSKSRDAVLETIREFSDEQLSEIPTGCEERGWSLQTALQVMSWHESHHQGQSHLTYNLWKVAQ